METGQQSTLARTVADEDTAVALGSGDLPVLATPRLLRFEVVATHGDGKVVGHGEVTRVVVDRERFLSRLT